MDFQVLNLRFKYPTDGRDMNRDSLLLVVCRYEFPERAGSHNQVQDSGGGRYLGAGFYRWVQRVGSFARGSCHRS
jgi:hypothetical protein